MQGLIATYNRIVEQTDCRYLRYIHKKIEWQERLIGIKGARGVGKTTMILQHIKLNFADRTKAFYTSLDNIWFSTHSLSELVEQLYTHGVTHIFLDEVHRYPTWTREIKNIYDSYPDLHIVFTGSSLLEIHNAEGDLSRRLRMYHLNGLSFREYLEITDIIQLPPVTLDELLDTHVQLAASLTSKIKILPHFEKYIQHGYLPFFIETSSEDSYRERMEKSITTVIENDLPAVEDIEFDTLQKIKRLLVTLTNTVPYTPSISKLCETLSSTRNQVIRTLVLLERAELIRMLHSEGKKLKAIGKPDKILFNNPNIMSALSSQPDIGTMRESFFASMISEAHDIRYPKQGDLLVNNKLLFEIGGRNKDFGQIRNVPYSYIAADEIETGFGNKLPLWMFGLLY